MEKNSNYLARYIPNSITILSLCCGLSSIRFAILNEWKISILLIIFAGIAAFLIFRLRNDAITKNDSIELEANGYVGGVQMTLSHGTDFSIDLVNAFIIAATSNNTNGEIYNVGSGVATTFLNMVKTVFGN